MAEFLGHRGSPSLENTLAGLRQALTAGLDGAEIDVRLTSDHEVVLFHDASLSRLTGRRGQVERMTLAELHEVSLTCGEQIPSLADVLSMWPSGKRLNIELKFGGEPLVDEVSKQVVGRTDVVLSSFVPKMLKAAGDEHPRALIVAPGSPAEHRRDGGAELGCQWVHASARMCTPEQIARYHQRGLEVGIWGAASLQEEARLVECGVARVITDFIGR